MTVSMNATCNGLISEMRETLLGPSRFMLIGASIELGIFDILRQKKRLSTALLVEETGILGAPRLMQIMQYPIKMELVSFDSVNDSFVATGILDMSEADFDLFKTFYRFVKEICLRQLYYLPESLKTGELVGLKELFGFEGIFYEAWDQHPSLKKAWTTFMDKFTALSEGWFYKSMDLPQGARVIDLAGNTGLGASLIHKSHPGRDLHVTNFDLPFKEEETLKFFAEEGLAKSCSFAGGDIFAAVPQGYDVAVISHFLDMFDETNVKKILSNVHQSLNPEGLLYILVPIYSEDVRQCHSVDFMPAYFLGCTMGQGGPQKISLYSEWLEECGFKIVETKAQTSRDVPALAPINEGIILAKKGKEL